eukprot:TRINITY_DN51075_c0_g1_i1.p1 TRINITY_DN51075_c0_g1~~TRINITY_DN51075_c0_g1_i1.p1  ORF type:complete len:550 (+),score=133.90 TRINITY_DN51075_c0_g1_i1:72-1721(+)
MIADDTFFTDEGGSPLLLRTFGPQPAGGAIAARCRKRVQAWSELASGVRSVARLGGVPAACLRRQPGAELLQVFDRDAERLFMGCSGSGKRTRARQTAHVECLKSLYAAVGDYHQGVGYLVAFLELFLPPSDVVAILTTLHRSCRHSMGYFACEPQAFARDARVLQQLLEVRLPILAEHFGRLGVVTELYVVKWFIGLAVTWLPVRILLAYWETYFLYGSNFLFAFALEFLSEFSAELLLEKTTGGVLALLRLEDPQAECCHPSQLGSPQLLHERLQRVMKLAQRAMQEPRASWIGAIPQLRSAAGADVAQRVVQARLALSDLALMEGSWLSDEEESGDEEVASPAESCHPQDAEIPPQRRMLHSQPELQQQQQSQAPELAGVPGVAPTAHRVAVVASRWPEAAAARCGGDGLRAACGSDETLGGRARQLLSSDGQSVRSATDNSRLAAKPGSLSARVRQPMSEDMLLRGLAAIGEVMAAESSERRVRRRLSFSAAVDAASASQPADVAEVPARDIPAAERHGAVATVASPQFRNGRKRGLHWLFGRFL